MADQPDLAPPKVEALNNVKILEIIFTYLHIGRPCCRTQTLKDAYHTLSQMKEQSVLQTSCPYHIRDLHACVLVSTVWSSVAIPQMWGHYAELHHILSVVYDTLPEYLRHLDENDQVNAPIPISFHS